jgi:hypothetical protein
MLEGNFREINFYEVRAYWGSGTDRLQQRGENMASNEVEIRNTPLRCINNGHRYSDDIEWVALRVEELDQPDWRPVTEGVTCPACGSPVEVAR